MPPKPNAPATAAVTAEAKAREMEKRQAILLGDLQADMVERELHELSLKTHKRALVLFFGRATFSDNTKYLYLEMVRAAGDMDVVWCASNTALYNQLRAHKLPCLDMTADPLAFSRELLQCSVAVFCENMMSAFSAMPELVGALAGAQKLQLWHGISVKHLDLMLLPFASPLDRMFRRTIKMSARPDMSLSTASALDSFWVRAHGATQLVRAGQPRNAVIRRTAIPEEMIGATLPSAQADIMNDPSVRRILVAPTWKRGQGLFTSSADFYGRLAKWATANNTVVFVKPHPFMSASALPASLPGRMYFLDAGTDVYPWLSRFDALVTDYSSIMFDFLLTGKPVFTFDALTQVSYGFEPDWSLVPDTAFRYEFDAKSFETVLSANIDTHPLRASQQQLCDQLFETDPLDASASLIRVIEACNTAVLDRPVDVIEVDVETDSEMASAA